MNLEKYQQYSRIARGLEQADLVLKDARIINVFTEEIIRGDIAIQDGIIAGIGSFQQGPLQYLWRLVKPDSALPPVLPLPQYVLLPE